MKIIKNFVKYSTIGLFNTAIHWCIFSFLVYCFSFYQSISNFLGFLVSVTFSFFANARFTFKDSATSLKYLLYITFMGALSLAVGIVSDVLDLHPLLTLVTFSIISLLLGFLYSNFIVFRKTK